MKKKFATRAADALPPEAVGKVLEIWFQDEARVGQQGTLCGLSLRGIAYGDGTLAYMRAPIGSRPPAVRDNRHASASLFGAICPDRAVGAAVVMPWVSSEVMSIHLAEISRCIRPNANAVLVCDGAGWHQIGQRLTVPSNITLLRRPPYAPELNPIENVWQYLRANQLSMIVWERYDAVVDACCKTWNWLMDDRNRIDHNTPVA